MCQRNMCLEKHGHDGEHEKHNLNLISTMSVTLVTEKIKQINIHPCATHTDKKQKQKTNREHIYRNSFYILLCAFFPETTEKPPFLLLFKPLYTNILTQYGWLHSVHSHTNLLSSQQRIIYRTLMLTATQKYMLSSSS